MKVVNGEWEIGGRCGHEGVYENKEKYESRNQYDNRIEGKVEQEDF